MQQAQAQYAGTKQPVMVKMPCGFCGNNPPYACKDCNEYEQEPPKEVRSINGAVPADFWYV